MPVLTTPEWIHWQNPSQELLTEGRHWSVGLRNDHGYHGAGNAPGEYMCLAGICTEDDARQMAAAPHMLAALRDVVAVMERDLAGLAVIRPELTAARSAIARATGAAP